MSISKILVTRKAKPIRLKSTRQEGLYIQFQLKSMNESFSHTGSRIGITKQVVQHVVFGCRRSARVEAEIARILGKNDWNEVVLEARSAVTGKPVNELVEEFNRKLQAKDAAVLSGLDATRAKAVAGNARPNPKAAPAGRRAV